MIPIVIASPRKTEARIAALRADSESDKEEADRILREMNSREAERTEQRERIERLRKADAPATTKKGGRK